MRLRPLLRAATAAALFAALAVGPLGCDSDSATGTTGDATDTWSHDAAGDVPAAPLVFCDAATRFDYDPLGGSVLTGFPDDALTRADAAATTGLRVAIGDPPWLDAQPTFFQPIYRDLESLDGWGTSAGILLRFSAAVGPAPSGETDSVASDALMLVHLDGGVATRVPYIAEAADDDETLILWPMVPLKPQARYAVIMSTGFAAADGGCVAPSAKLQALLRGEATGDLAMLNSRYADMLSATGLRGDAVSAALVFTTQAVHDASLAARDDIVNQKTFRWSAKPTCNDNQGVTLCRSTFTAWDYRREGYLGGDPIVPEAYEMPVRVWLPTTGQGPFPTLIFGHGLGGTGANGAALAGSATSQGYAVVSISQPRHGDHPTAGSDPNGFFIDLLGIDIASFTIRGLVFRENLRQGALDKLQLVELLRTSPDVSGDGKADIDVDNLAYYGVSLGGIMGSDVLALSANIDAAILAVAGGRLVSILTDGENFAQFRELLINLAGSPAEMTRMAPIAQTLIDAGDPVNYAPHVLSDRFDDGEPPNVLLAIAMGDATVPNITSRALARALGVTHVPPVAEDVGVIEVAAQAPLVGNVAAGARTAGLFQYDRVSVVAGGLARPASHSNVFSSVEMQRQTFDFLDGWRLLPAPEIIDPYAIYQTPPLP